MKYKLIEKNYEQDTPITRILVNRGIEEKDIYHYLNTTDEDINDYNLLGGDALKAAAQAVLSAMAENKKCFLVVDSDCDGFTSAAVLLNYLHHISPTWVENCVDWFIHEGKQHGLNDCIDCAIDYPLVICPDSASNDYEEHQLIKENGGQLIILDHHEAPEVSKDAIVINNQLSDYPNKQLSGVGVVWQFCRYLDTLNETNYANEYLDLVALGLCADMMSLLSIETKHLMLKGFKNENIKNPFIYYMQKKNSFKLGDEITPIGAAFYIAPLVNATMRSGTLEEKELLFKSMLKYIAFQEVPSTKRGHKLGELEMIVTQAVRTVTNVKNRQTKTEKKGMEFLYNKIQDENLLDHKVVLFLVEEGEIDKNIAGLIANKFMAQLQRPCCILMHNEATDTYNGSARGYSKSGCENFKDICEETGMIEFAAGHQNAFGLGIKSENVQEFLEITDELLKDIDDEPYYKLDFLFDAQNINFQVIRDICGLNYLWGQDMDEPFIGLHNLRVTSDMVDIYYKSTNTLKITLPNKFSILKFKASDKECEQFENIKGYIELDIIGRANLNDFNGSVYPQLFVEDYEIIDSFSYYF